MSLRCPLFIVALLLMLGSAAGLRVGAQEAAPRGELRVRELRTIEIPDIRLISMSPDGRWLAAAKPAVGYQRGELCIYAVATLAEQSCADLSVLEAGLRIEDVVWSPDSSRLAFAEQTFEFLRDGDLWVMDVATGALTNVDDDSFRGERLPMPIFGGEARAAAISLPVNPAFSPDGRSLAFSRTIIRAGEWAGNDIAIVELDGGASERLVRVSDQTPGVVIFGIRWAPDGRRLYYSVHDPQVGHPDNGIWVVGADGGNARHLLRTTDPERGPPSVVQISPRGDKLLALYPLAATDFGFRGAVYALVNVATGAAEPLTIRAPAAPELAWVALATISPDGSKLLTVTRLTDPDFQVFVRDLDTGKEALLVDGLPGAAPVAWGIVPTWGTNGTIFIADGARLSAGTLLHVEG